MNGFWKFMQSLLWVSVALTVLVICAIPVTIYLIVQGRRKKQ